MHDSVQDAQLPVRHMDNTKKKGKTAAGVLRKLQQEFRRLMVNKQEQPGG
jgi:hypothetical protein